MKTKFYDRWIDQICGMAVQTMKVCTLLFLLAPLIFVILMSFNPSFLAFPPKGFSLSWYVDFITRRDFWDSLKASFAIGISTTVISLIFGTLCGFVLARCQFRGKSFLEVFFLSPLIIPEIALGIALLNFFVLLGIVGSFNMLLIAHVVITLPYVIRVVTGNLVGFDRSLEEAAQNLGANEIQTFTKITLPLIKAGLVAGAIFAFATSFNDVSASVFLTSPAVTTLPVLLFSWIQYIIEPTIAAVSTFLIIFTTGVLLITEKIAGLEKLVGAGLGR